jgi:cytochrome b561
VQGIIRASRSGAVSKGTRMTYGNLSGGYPPVSKLLHWVIAACVLITIPVAFWMSNTSNEALANNLFNLHKSIGALILVLMVLRVINRFVSGAPAPESNLEPWQRTVSSAVHGLLYVLLLLMPIVGYLANSAYGAGTPTPFFGLFSIPPIIGPNEALSERLFALHRYTGWLVTFLVVMHVGAALFHYFTRRDGVLQRMLPKALGGN